jgi:dynein heavy chain
MDMAGDYRLEYLGSVVQKSLKLKPEKWGRLLMSEDYRNLVLDFLDNPVPAALFVVLTPNAQLVPSCGFPIPCQRTKGILKAQANTKRS